VPTITAAGANAPVKVYRKVWSETRKGECSWRLVGEN
jgi:hypothetical protein